MGLNLGSMRIVIVLELVRTSFDCCLHFEFNQSLIWWFFMFMRKPSFHSFYYPLVCSFELHSLSFFFADVRFFFFHSSNLILYHNWKWRHETWSTVNGQSSDQIKVQLLYYEFSIYSAPGYCSTNPFISCYCGCIEMSSCMSHLYPLSIFTIFFAQFQFKLRSMNFVPSIFFSFFFFSSNFSITIDSSTQVNFFAKWKTKKRKEQKTLSKTKTISIFQDWSLFRLSFGLFRAFQTYEKFSHYYSVFRFSK